jgi:hypothetical protein
VPLSLPVALTVISGDGRAHHVLLRTRKPISLTVPAGAHATVLVRGLRVGRYRLEVDGKPRGTLVIGVAAGP